MVIYVLSKDKEPLMPTKRCGKVRHLLKDGKARVVYRCPFTIQLLYETNTYTQDLTLGGDTGSGDAAFGVSTNDVDENEKKHIKYKSTVEIRNDIKAKMDRRRELRRIRRNRLRYRPARFKNRKNSKRKDRFSPTMTSKIDSHVKEIELVKKILPITNITLEVGQFDTQLMANPQLANPKVKPWGYQKGPNYGFANTKARVLNRDNYTCQYCKTKKKGTRLEVHHIVYRSHNGSDDADNLITLCHDCHTALHNGEITLKQKGKKNGTLNHATQMNSIRKQLLKRYPEAVETFGYVTKENRQLLGLPKDHYIDACVIATGGVPFVDDTDVLYCKKSVAKGDYQQTKGQRSEIKIPTGKIQGFKKYDKVLYLGKEYFIKGRMSSGYCILMDIDGKKVDFSDQPKGFKTPKLCNLKRIGARKSCLVTAKAVTLNTP